MLGSPNGPAYGSQPKLVVMKVLCKLRWRKIRHPLIFPSSLFLFICSLYSSLWFLSSCSFFFHCSLSLFWQGVSFSLHHILSLSAPLYFLYLSRFPSFRLCLIFSSLSTLSCLSLSLCVFLFSFFWGIPESVFCPYLTPSNGLFTLTHTLICSIPPFGISCRRCLCAFVCRWVGRCCLSSSCAVRTNSSRSAERWDEKTDDRHLPPSCIPLAVSLSLYLCIPCFFSSSHQITFSWPATLTGYVCHAVSGQGHFQATFQDMANACQCPAPCPLVRQFKILQIPINYTKKKNPCSCNRSLLWINKRTAMARQDCHKHKLNKHKIELWRHCIKRCCY